MGAISKIDPQVGVLLNNEKKRQRNTINLIASENYASRAVLEAQGSVLTNKYAEGYPGRRYYGGCCEVNEIERLAIERAEQLFKAEYANVQPHSGAQANLATYFSVLEHGDTILAQNLAHGGHLTHGSPVNFSGRHYKVIPYGVNRHTEQIDYDEMERLAKTHRPKLIVAGASAYPRIIDFQRFRQIADEVEAILMVDMAHIAGLVAAGVHPSPVPYAELVTSTTHKTLRGPRGGFVLCRKEYGPRLDAAVFPGMQGGPLMHVIAAKAVSFKEAMQPEFVNYQRAVVANARTLAAELNQNGLRIVSGGTENHLVLVDLGATGITGKQAEEALENAGIAVNRNAIPFDLRPPQQASGIRLGTPAVTSRGFGTEEIKRVAAMIIQVLNSVGNAKVASQVRQEVRAICQRFPAPGVSV